MPWLLVGRLFPGLLNLCFAGIISRKRQIFLRKASRMHDFDILKRGTAFDKQLWSLFLSHNRKQYSLRIYVFLRFSFLRLVILGGVLWTIKYFNSPLNLRSLSHLKQLL